MATATHQRRPPLGLFPDRPAPRLYDRCVEAPRVRHDSRRTEQAYVHWIRRYILFHQHRHPRQLAEADVNRFLTSLAVKDHVAASTQNQALAAILFLYHHLHESTVQKAVKDGSRAAGLPQRVTTHTFRHSFATHLLEVCYDIRTVQELLGHQDVKTTMVDTHVLNKGGRGVRSPLEGIRELLREEQRSNEQNVMPPRKSG